MGKGISGFLRRKSKSEKETSTEAKRLEDEPSEPVSSTIETETSQVSEENSNFQSTTCPNSRCGKVFDKPLELVNLAEPSDESCPVCPYCLSKLESPQPEQTMTETETISEQQPQEMAEPKVGECPHFVGYLAKRPKNTPIPDFCLTCPEMMKCLLG